MTHRIFKNDLREQLREKMRKIKVSSGES